MLNKGKAEKMNSKTVFDQDYGMRHKAQQVLALLAAGLGLFVIIAWVAGDPQLAAFGQGMIPMAPSTAILFLIFGSIIFLHGQLPQSSLVKKICLLFGWAGTFISALLFALHAAGISSSIEHLGIQITRTINGVSLGHMSPLAAVCFIFTGLSILMLISSSSNHKWKYVESYGLAAIISMINIVLLMAYLWGKPFLYRTGIIPPAIPTSLAFIMMAMAILLLSRLQNRQSNNVNETTGINAAYFYIAMLTLAATGLITLGYLYIRNFEQQYRSEIDKQLVFVANAKTDGLLQWKHERLGDASVFYDNPAFIGLVSRYLEDSTGANIQKQLHGWLAKLETYAEYDRVILLDTRYNNRMSVPEKNEPVDKPLIKQAIESMRSGQIGFVDFYLCENDHRVYLGIVVPIIDEPGNQRIGAIALCIDPEKQLYPTINKQFQLNRTGESILVRRDGDSVLFLNKLKFRENTALKMRVSIAGNEDLPSVKAVLGQEGIVEGADYRGKPVIAAVSAVSGMPWFLLDKIDQSEAYAPVRNRAWMTIGLVGLLLLGMAISLVFVWRQRRMQYYHEKSVAEEALRESHEVLQAVLNSIPVRVFWKDLNLQLLGCNTPFAKDAGFEKPEDIIGKDDYFMGWREQADLYRADDRAVIQSGKGKYLIDEPQTTPSGEMIHLLTSKVPLRDADGAIVGVLGTYQDITELKRAENAFRESEERFRNLVENTGEGIGIADLEERFTFVNKAAEELFGVPKGKLVGRNIREFVDDIQFEHISEIVLERSRGQSTSYHLEINRDDGTRRTIMVNSTTRYDGSNNTVGSFAIFRDITELKQVQDDLNFRNLLLATQQEATLDGILVVGKNAEILSFNNKFIDIWGIPPELLDTKADEPLLKYVMDQQIDPQKFREKVVYIYSHINETYHDELELKNGKTFERYSAPMIDEKGNYFGRVWHFRDITDHRDFERKLKIFSDAVEGANDGFLMSDSNGRISYVNKSVEKYFGYSREELMGKPIDVLSKNPEEAKDIFKKVLDNGKWDGEVLSVKKNGESFVASLSLSFVTTQDNIPIGTMGVLRDITERKKAEQALRESEQRLGGILDATPFPIALVDVEGNNIEYWSRSAINLFGHTAPTATEWYQRAYPDANYRREVIEQWNPCVEKARLTGQAVNAGEYRITCSDGSVCICELYAAFIADKLIVTFNDLTVRKMAEADLRQSEKRLSSIFDAAGDVIFMVSLVNGRFQFESVNHAFEQITGLSKNLVEGKYVDEVIPEPSLSIVLKNYEIAIREHKTIRWEEVSTYPTGTITGIVTVAPILNENGECTMLVGGVHDITERERAEEALRESEEKYRTIIENMQDAFYRTDFDGKLILLSPSGARHLGYDSADQLIGVDVAKDLYADAEDRPRFLKALMAEGSVRDFELRLKRKDGSVFYCSASSQFYRDADGKVVGVEGILRDINERKQAEQDLRASEERYRLLIENANEAIFVIQDLKIPFSNNKLAEILDYHNEYVIEKNLLDYIHPDDREIVTNRLMARTEGGQIEKPTPFRALASDGSYKWLEVDAVRIEWNGQPATLNFATDITERILAQNSLKESEVKFRNIFEHSSEAAFLMTDKFLDCNQMACELWGYSREEIIGKSPSLFSPEIQPNGRNSLEASTEYINAAFAGTPQVFYWQHKRNNGSLIDTEASLASMAIDGKLMVHAVVRDITQRKRSEETLRKLATVIEQSADGVVITNIDGIMEYVNPAYERITGIKKDEVIGSLFRLFVNSPQNAVLYNEIQASIKRKRTCTATIQSIKKDGNPFNESVTISPVFNSAGTLINYVIIARDITRQMVLEQQMLQSQKMEAIGQLAGGVAHDFNNLLTAILGYGEILRNNLEGQDRLQKDVDEITKAGKRAAALTRQLLAFSRKQVIQPKVLDLNSIVKDIHKMLRRLIGENVELVAVEDKNLWKIKADPGQIEQVIMNLSVNARDAMPNGGTLTIETTNATYDNLSDTAKNKLNQSEYALLTVTDTGLGIPDDIKPHIFEPFYTTKEQGKGTGLGLSTVYGIVEQSGGYIEVESKAGSGTTFKIYLPRHAEPTLKTGKIDTQPELIGGNETILIVEDDDAVMDLTQRLLSGLGYNILSSGDPLEALEICKQFKTEIKLLLTDVVMPKMNGEELARAVKVIIPEISILFMTGYTDNAFVQHEILESQGDLLPKPFSKELLARKIRELFERKTLQKAIDAVVVT